LADQVVDGGLILKWTFK